MIGHLNFLSTGLATIKLTFIRWFQQGGIPMKQNATSKTILAIALSLALSATSMPVQAQDQKYPLQVIMDDTKTSSNK